MGETTVLYIYPGTEGYKQGMGAYLIEPKRVQSKFVVQGYHNGIMIAYHSYYTCSGY